MLTYFKPLRRKIGVATSGLACVLIGVGIRSYYVTDGVLVGGVQLYSTYGAFMRTTAPHNDPNGPNWIPLWVVPYWSLVAPLTMLSIWLLLSKSREKKIELKPVPDSLR